MASTLGNAVEFLEDLGLFDVVLPFLLIFSIIFAILEKTAVLGKDKKNINSIVALSMALITIAANKVVSTLLTALPNIVLLTVISLSFLIQLGLYWGQDEQKKSFREKHENWYRVFVLVLFVGVILIFSNSFENDEGKTWLQAGWDYIVDTAGEGAVAGVLFLIIVAGVVYYAQKTPGSGGGK